MALQEYYNSGDNNDVPLQVSGTRLYGQPWLTTSAYTIGSVKLKLQRSGAGGTVTVEIWATSGGEPDGSALTSGTFDATSVTTDAGGAWYEITLTPLALSDATTYAIVVYCSSNDTILWRYVSAGTYPDGEFKTSTDSGSTWTDVNIFNGDAMFEIYSGIADTDKLMEGTIAGSGDLSASLVRDFDLSVTISSVSSFSSVLGAGTFLSGTLSGVAAMSAYLATRVDNVDTTSKRYIVVFGNNTVYYTSA